MWIVLELTVVEMLISLALVLYDNLLSKNIKYHFFFFSVRHTSATIQHLELGKNEVSSESHHIKEPQSLYSYSYPIFIVLSLRNVYISKFWSNGEWLHYITEWINAIIMHMNEYKTYVNEAAALEYEDQTCFLHVVEDYI